MRTGRFLFREIAPEYGKNKACATRIEELLAKKAPAEGL